MHISRARRCARSTEAPPACDRSATAPPKGLLEQARLHTVPSTLLIPLAARARGDGYFPWLACEDVAAPQVLDRLGANVDALLDDLPTVLNVLWRTRAIQQAGRSFFQAHPRSAGVSLGCGLSHHFQWLDNGGNQWLDADLPEVAALRAQLLPVRCPRTRQASVDITRPGWWQRLRLPHAQDGPQAAPVFIVCEGVLMYLQPAQVQAVLRELAECAPAGSQLVLDVLTHHAVGRAARHASVGPTGAEFRWGVHRMRELADMHPRLSLLREQSVAECYGWPALAMELLWWPWLGAPLYGLATLGVGAAETDQ